MQLDINKNRKSLSRPHVRSDSPFAQTSSGFTLIEVLMSLFLGTLIVGGIMGVISVSLQFMQRVDRKSAVQPVLEAAAQKIILDPEKAKEGNLTLEEFSDKPSVNITITTVIGPDGYDISNRGGDLYRVRLDHEGNMLEFSLIIPQSDFQ